MGILDLADELLRIILEYVASESERPLGLERRAYLSQESFKLPLPLEPDNADTIANFRLTCKKFSDLGIIHLFSRVTTRFSKKGLDRLQKIANQPHLARRVKKFSYMVPFFYDQGRERIQELLRTRPESFGFLDTFKFQEKVSEQRDILRTRQDARILHFALQRFTSLQHVQILRLQDQEDGVLISYMRGHNELNSLVPTWPPACLHSAKTIGQALLESESPCSRFSSPMLSPQSVLGAADNPPSTLGILAERLTCLELHFDDSTDLDVRMRHLSSLSKALFIAAKNIEAVHIGFPSYRPLTLRLEELFHNVKWDKLQAFGIQAWRLDADEILGIARRHKDTLRGLRLRDVLLKEGSMWRDVLPCLRDDLIRLNWVSLRRIGYEQYFDEQFIAGAEVPLESSNDESDDDSQYDGEYDDLSDEHSSTADTESDAETDEPEQGFTLHFPPILDTQASIPWCNCNGHMESVDALGDDGIMVTNQQRKFWEKWVVRKICTEQHGHK
ncbi:hypothetical protein G6011_06549 [Alternaria panax]|uniref:Uncharacterized protein n=1 Tax=Alternaria panax TaxID=48097 RepID=A0AAD4FHE8_9PLEO|nr:hypothetical protein G6011_06549 [Alternaria panax]